MPNTNTTYSPFNLCDSICPLYENEKDTFIICPPVVSSLPYTPLQTNQNLPGNLLFTIVFLMIFAFVRLRGKELLNNLLHVFIKRKKAEIVQNEGIASNLICYVLSLCLSFSVLSVCISFVAWDLFLTLQSVYLFTGLLAYHFFLIFLVHMLGWTFNARNMADEVIINIWTFHILVGLLVSPFILALFFVRNYAVLPLLKIVIFSLILFMSVKIIRWFEILFSYRVSVLYMFLYLCALEIMPLLVLYKVVVYK